MDAHTYTYHHLEAMENEGETTVGTYKMQYLPNGWQDKAQALETIIKQ